MSFENIGSAMGILFDELKNDKQSKKLIKQIDQAASDDDIKKGIVPGVKRLRELGKNSLADDLEKKTKGFVSFDFAHRNVGFSFTSFLVYSRDVDIYSGTVGLICCFLYASARSLLFRPKFHQWLE